MESSKRTCTRCGKEFKYPYLLRRHQTRKTPCAPIVEQEELPIEEKAKPYACRFCGHRFRSESSLSTHIRRHCKIALTPDGLQRLYEHTLRKQQEQIEEQTRRINLLERAMRHKSPTFQVVNNVLGNQININIFGGETVSHINPEKVRGVLDESIQASADPVQGATQALLKAAALIYSDPTYPENLTCYLPNKRKDDVMIHSNEGWEIQPCRLVLPPMTKKSMDALFSHQPFEDAERYGDLMRALRDNEEAYMQGKQMKTVLVRNRELLEKALGKLPHPSSCDA